MELTDTDTDRLRLLRDRRIQNGRQVNKVEAFKEGNTVHWRMLDKKAQQLDQGKFTSGEAEAEDWTEVSFK